MIEQIQFFAGAARVLEGKSSGEYMRGHTSSIRREPIGPVAQVAPWNYPMMMSVWKFAPALAAGNTVVLKPSDTTPASSYWMVEKMQDIFPPGVCNLVCGDRDTGAALTAHPIPQLVSITGSTGAGIAVATAAAKDLKRAHLELGGKAPVVVFNDADIEAAIEGISVAGLFNGGQDCTAATRLIVQEGDLRRVRRSAHRRREGHQDRLRQGGRGHPLRPDQQRQPARPRVRPRGPGAGPRPGHHRRTPDRRTRLLLRADDRCRPRAAGRADPDRDLRAGPHRPEVHRRGGGAEVLQRQRVRAGLIGVDEGHQHCIADGCQARFRLRLGQHAHPADRRDAARRVQAFGLRQGPVDVRSRGLHPYQARDDLPRLSRADRKVHTSLGRRGDWA